MTHKHAEHGGILQQLQEANREVRARLEQLEKREGPGSVAGSTVAPSSEGGRPPALVIGGWDPDQDARVTKREAEDILKSVGAPISLDSLFVPGMRRGYAILPLDTKPGESFDERRGRVQEVISKVRAANMHLGVRADGGARRLWIAMSQPPEKRRRARLAAKVKRLFLTLGGDKNLLEMEYSTGTAWIGGVKVCSATASRPGGADEVGPGWVDVTAIAKGARVHQRSAGQSMVPAQGGDQLRPGARQRVSSPGRGEYRPYTVDCDLECRGPHSWKCSSRSGDILLCVTFAS